MITTVPIIEIDKIGKAYRYYGSEWQRVLSWFGLNFKPNHEHWTLEAITFKIYPQEAIGILGKNGAGKSTLLKIISGILKPSTGTIQVRGRIAAILELGMGFQPDLTGRQNAYHATGLMGYSQKQIDTVINDIESFADIGEYFDQPVRTYSSGMQARVAFSIAVAFRPEILIVDEVLSVGDAAFQRKCFRKIEEFMEAGTTLLFVSHDIETVKKICSKAIFLENGQMIDFGPAKKVCDMYEKSLFSINDVSTTPTQALTLFDDELITEEGISYGDGRAFITDVRIENMNTHKVNIISQGINFSLKYKVCFHDDVSNPDFAMMIKTREGIAVYGTNSSLTNNSGSLYSAGDEVLVSFDLINNLAPGIYYLNCGVRDNTQEENNFLHRLIDTLIFKITRSEMSTVGTGLVELNGHFNISKLTRIES